MMSRIEIPPYPTLVLVAVLGVFSVAAFAQETTGSISGTDNRCQWSERQGCYCDANEY